MWIKEIILAALGLICGAATAAGTFSLINSVGVVPRMSVKSSTAIHVTAYENAIIAGGITGNILSVFFDIPIRPGMWILAAGGIFAGIFVGCLAAALAEVLQVWPVIFRRIGLKKGLNAGMFCFAMGKLAGSLYFFLVLYKK